MKFSSKKFTIDDITDLISVEDLQNIQNKFSVLHNVASMIMDPEGNLITEPSNFCRVCQIIRNTKKGSQNCKNSSRRLGENTLKYLRPTVEKCHSCGFADGAVPIVVNGQHIATWGIGQAKIEELPEDAIKKYAEYIGADPDLLWGEYRKIPLNSEDGFKKILQFLGLFAEKLSELAYANVLAHEENKKRVEAEEELNSRIHDLDVISHRSAVMIEENPVAMLLADMTYAITDHNHAFLDMSGYPTETLKRMRLGDIPHKVLENFSLKDAIVDKKEIRGNVELNFPKYSGIFDCHAIPLSDNKGDFTNVLMVFVDITEKYNREQEILKLQSQTNGMIEENPAAIMLMDKNFRITSTNRAWLEITGYAREHVLEMSLRDYDIYDRSGNGAQEALARKMQETGELSLRCPTGVKRLEYYYIPLMDENREVTDILAVYVDITTMVEKINQIETMVEQNPLSITIISPELRFVSANPAFYALSGYTEAEVIGKHMLDLDITKFEGEGAKHVIHTKKRGEGFLEWNLPAGRKYVIIYTIPFFDEQHEITHMMGVYVDVTEKQNADEALACSTDEIAKSLEALAAGDLTKPAIRSDGDPLDQIKANYNIAVDTLNSMLKEVIESIGGLEHMIHDVGKGADNLAVLSQNVTTGAHNTSDRVKQQILQLESVLEDIDHLSTSTNDIAGRSNEVSDLTTGVSDAGVSALELGNEATGKMKVVEEISELALDEIGDLNQHIQEISKVVKIITDIANQTNLLALNAAIEAARAGDAGRGFAVVAGEVKNLAGESKGATGHIVEMIEGITSGSERTSESMKKVYDEIISGISSVNQTIDALNGMVNDVNHVTSSMSEISGATAAQASATENVTKSVDIISTMIQDADSNMENLMGIAGESSASAEQIAGSSEEMRRMVQNLKERADEFII